MKDNNNLGFEALGALVFTLTIGLLGSLYKAYILTDIATWFNFPLQLTLVQWFGISELFTLINFKYNSTDPKPKSIYADIFVYYILVSVIWGILWFAHLIIK